MKRWTSLLAGAAIILAGTASIGAAPPEENEPFFTEGEAPLEVTVTDTGWVAHLTPAAAEEAGLSAEEARDAECEGTYFFQRVNNTIEWGSQNSCSPSLPPEYAPQRINVTLEGTCNDPFCLIWAVESGQITSGDVYTRVATATSADVCDSNELRQFRIAVQIKYNNVDRGTATSAPWSGIDCDI